MIQFRKEFEDACLEKFKSDAKIGIYCSLAPDHYPHMSLITSINVKTKSSYMWGQFSRGLSKDYLRDNPKTGFLVISPDQYWWTGKSLHRETALKGEDYEFFNNKPLFRYNSYCSYGVIHYEDLIDVSVGEKIPALAFAWGFCTSSLLKGAAAKRLPPLTRPQLEKLPPYGVSLLSKVATLKFIAWEDTDGFPRLVPALQGTTVDANHLVFAASPYGELLDQIPPGAKAGVYLATLDLESLLVQGRWQGIKRYGLFRGAVLEVDKVYNSMLPLTRYIYPPAELPRVFAE